MADGRWARQDLGRLVRRAAWPVLSLAIGACVEGVPGPAAPGERPAQGGEPGVSAEAPMDGKPGAETPPPASAEPLLVDARNLARGVGGAQDEALHCGDEALDAEAWDTASSCFRRAQQLVPEDPAPRVGLYRSALGRRGGAVGFGEGEGDPFFAQWGEELAALRARCPDYVPLALELGRLELMRANVEASRSLLVEAAGKLPGDAEAQSAYGLSLMAQGQVRLALRRFEAAAHLEPDQAGRWVNWGTGLLIEERLQEAIWAFGKARRLEPDNAVALNGLATAQLSAGRVAEAVEHLERVVQLEPERATYRSNLGYAEQQLGHFERAEALYAEALLLDPKLGSAWLNLGLLRVEEQRYDDAREAFDEALELDPSDPRAQQAVADLRALASESP